jgi:hypothetical protein
MRMEVVELLYLVWFSLLFVSLASVLNILTFAVSVVHFIRFSGIWSGEGDDYEVAFADTQGSSSNLEVGFDSEGESNLELWNFLNDSH